MELATLPDWSLWGILAAMLLVAEMLTTAYVAFGFAVAAALLAVLNWWLPGLPLVWQALIWAAAGLTVWYGLARWNARRRALRRDINDYDPRDSLPPSDRAAQRRDHSGGKGP